MVFVVSGYFENPDIYIQIYMIYTIHALHPKTRCQVWVLDNCHCSDVENAGFSAAKRACGIQNSRSQRVVCSKKSWNCRVDFTSSLKSRTSQARR